MICCCHTFFREQTRRATRARHSPPESWLLFSGYKPKLTSVSPPAKFALTGILMSVGQTVKSIHLSKSKPTAFSLSQAGTKPVPVCSQRPSRALGHRALPPQPCGAARPQPRPLLHCSVGNFKGDLLGKTRNLQFGVFRGREVARQVLSMGSAGSLRLAAPLQPQWSSPLAAQHHVPVPRTHIGPGAPQGFSLQPVGAGCCPGVLPAESSISARCACAPRVR